MAQRRGPYRKTAARRAQILEAAQAVFAENGYTASSVNEIARRIGITQTGILHHFAGGKPELLRAVLEQRDEGARAAVAGAHGVDFLRALVRISRQQAERPGVVQLYKILSAEATDPDHPAHQHFRDRLAMIHRELTRAFEEVAAEGLLRAGISPEQAATDALTTVEGAESLWLQGLPIDMAEHVRWRFSQLLTTPLEAPTTSATSDSAPGGDPVSA